MIYQVGTRSPSIDPSCFVAESAQLIGSVVMHRDASVWFGAVIRADNSLVTIGEGSNVQDNSVIHSDDGIDVVLGRGVTVGHKVMLHGCEVGDYSLVGIGAILLNRVKVGNHCLIGAGTLLTEGKQIPERSLVLGSPGRVVRALTDAEVMQLKFGAAHYVQNSRRYRETLRPA